MNLNSPAVVYNSVISRASGVQYLKYFPGKIYRFRVSTMSVEYNGSMTIKRSPNLPPMPEMNRVKEYIGMYRYYPKPALITST